MRNILKALVLLVVIVANAGSQSVDFEVQKLTCQEIARSAKMISLASTVAPTMGGLTIALLSLDQFEGTAAISSVSLLFAGVVIGPSTGYFYGGKSGRGVGGIVLRFLPAALAGGSAATAAAFNSSGAPIAGIVVMGGGIVVGSMIYDLTHVHGDVLKHQLREKGFAFGTTFFPKSNVPGLQMIFSF